VEREGIPVKADRHIGGRPRGMRPHRLYIGAEVPVTITARHGSGWGPPLRGEGPGSARKRRRRIRVSRRVRRPPPRRHPLIVASPASAIRAISSGGRSRVGSRNSSKHPAPSATLDLCQESGSASAPTIRPSCVPTEVKDQAADSSRVLQPRQRDRADTVAARHGITLPDQEPIPHFAARQDALVWPPTVDS
jgi:hypothetical protein